MTREYRQLVETIYRRHGTLLQIQLRREFPRADHALVEDAVENAFLDAWERPAAFVAAWQEGGQHRLLRLFKQVSWRHLRGHFRKKSSQCEIGMKHIPQQPRDLLTPHVLATGRETTTQVLRLADEAAVRFGGGRSQALRAALHARLAGGTDTDVARSHHIPREYVNRAKRWIGARLQEAGMAV